MNTELYFKRNKMQENISDIYQYDKFPKAFRVQVFHILTDVFYSPEDLEVKNLRGGVRVITDSKDPTLFLRNINEEMSKICKKFSREKGRLSIKSATNQVKTLNGYQAILEFIVSEQDTDDFLTILEMVFNVIENKASEFSFGKREDAYDIAQEAIDELNRRFYEHNVGYQYQNGQIVKVDSELIHTEAVKPALHLLSNPEYKGAEKEFLKAHEYYRNNDYSAAMMECLKAYESTLKIILEKNDKEYSPNATADELTGKVMQLELMPEFWKQHFKSLKNTLTAGVPTARNKLAGHGAGNESREIPEYLISYVLHMTASAIVFLVKAEESLPR